MVAQCSTPPGVTCGLADQEYTRAAQEVDGQHANAIIDTEIHVYQPMHKSIIILLCNQLYELYCMHCTLVKNHVFS